MASRPDGVNQTQTRMFISKQRDIHKDHIVNMSGFKTNEKFHLVVASYKLILIKSF